VTEGAPDRGGARTGAAAAPLDLLAIWAVYALLTVRFWFVTDDAFISFRYARHFALGEGLRYNLGSSLPVEGYSNFLWVLLCALVEWLRADVTFWAPLASFALGSILVARVHRALCGPLALERPVAFLGAASLAWFPPFFVWSSSGLETVPFALLAFLCFEALVLRRDGPSGVRAGLAAAGLVWIRAEGFAWAALVAAAYLASVLLRRLAGEETERPGPPLGWLVLLGGGAFALQTAGRLAYYGSLVANTAVAKVAIGPATLARGFDYTAVYYLTFLTPFAVLAAGAACLGARIRARALPCYALALVPSAYAIAVSGDFMAMGRLFVVGLPFGALVIAWAFDAARRAAPVAWARTAVLVAGGALIAVGLLPIVPFQLVPESVRARHHFRLNTRQYRNELAQWQAMVDNTREWTELGRTIGRFSRPGDSLTRDAIGAVGYYSDVFIYDTLGLVSREVAARPVKRLLSPGHDKMVPVTFFLDRKPTLLGARIVADTRLAAALSASLDRAQALADEGHPYYPELHDLGDGRHYLAMRRAETQDEWTAAMEEARRQLGTAGAGPVGRPRSSLPQSATPATPKSSTRPVT